VTPVRVYVAAPYADAPRVRAVHDELRNAGFEPTSRWADAANGPETLDVLPLSDVRAIARANDDDLQRAHFLLVLARDGAGGEMFAETRLALDSGIPVVWVGSRRPLTAYREGVVRVGDVNEALSFARSFAVLIARSWIVGADWARAVVWSFIVDRENAEAPDAA
jgi:hypothetical protein